MALKPGSKPLNHFNGIPYYSRSLLRKVHSKSVWMRRYGRIIKENQKDRPVKESVRKRKRRGVITETRNGLYGPWQTERYVPPRVTVPGKVPRNEYGNVELFHPWMIPVGCIHIPHKRAAHVAGALGIDYAQAIIGFDSKGGNAFPVMEGVVVCIEYADAVISALEQVVDEAQAAAAAQRHARAVALWKDLVARVLIYERLRLQDEGV